MGSSYIAHGAPLLLLQAKADEFGTGQVLWSIIWFFLFFIWIMLIFQIFGDIMRSDISGVSKALWSVLIIFLPYIGVFAYLSV